MTFTAVAQNDGFIGLGFSSTGGMAGADIVYGRLGEGAVPEVVDAQSVEEARPVEDAQLGGTSDVTDAEFSVSAGGEGTSKTTTSAATSTTTMLRFTRRLVTGDPKDAKLVAEQPFKLIFAVGPHDLSGHRMDRRGFAEITLSRPGEYTVTIAGWSLGTWVHVCGMLVVWVVAAPVGAFVIRHFKTSTVHATRLHVASMTAVVAATVVLLLVVAVPRLRDEIGRAHV